MNNRIKEIREKLQMKQTALAKLSGVSRATINGLETGYIEVTTTETLEKIAEAMNVKVWDLFATPAQNDVAVVLGGDKFEAVLKNTGKIKKALRKQLELLAETVQKTGYEDGDEVICEAFEEAARELTRWGSLEVWMRRLEQ